MQKYFLILQSLIVFSIAVLAVFLTEKSIFLSRLLENSELCVHLALEKEGEKGKNERNFTVEWRMLNC